MAQEFVLTREQADEVIAKMREAVNEVPSYIETQASKARQENQEELDNAA